MKLILKILFKFSAYIRFRAIFSVVAELLFADKRNTN